MALRPPGGRRFPSPRWRVGAPSKLARVARLPVLSDQRILKFSADVLPTPIRDELEFDRLPYIETSEASTLHR
jgi:hypothetical protein